MAYLYRLTSPSGKSYIGIANNYRKRWSMHRYRATRGDNSAIYCAIRKYKWESFSSEVLVIGSFEYVKDLEVKAIEAFNTMYPNGYNLTKGGDGSVGRQMPQHVRDKIRASNTGQKRDALMRQRLSAARKGKSVTTEQRAKISIKMKQVCDTEWRKRRAESQRKLWADPEYRAKMLAKMAEKRLQSK
jgi:group I intron endonuclease